MEPQLPPNADPEDRANEENKLHARKTRVRKKKLMHEMERIVSNLGRSRVSPVSKPFRHSGGGRCPWRRREDGDGGELGLRDECRS